MPSTANLTPAASILSTERVVATLANGNTVGVLASGLPVSTAQTAAFQPLDADLTAYANAADAAARATLAGVGPTQAVSFRSVTIGDDVADATLRLYDGAPDAFLDISPRDGTLGFIYSATYGGFSVTFPLQPAGQAIIEASAVTADRVYTLPDASGTLGFAPVAVTANLTAGFDEVYEVFASATFTDPTNPRPGGYVVRVRNGTATIGGVAYTEGQWWRVWHSGSWSTRRIGFTAADAEAARTALVINGNTVPSPALGNIAFDGTVAARLNELHAGKQPLDADLTAYADAADAAARRALIGAENASNLSAGTLATARLPAMTGGDATTTAGSGAITLAAVGTAGTYQAVTVDAKGRVTSGSNPTTLAGYGITDATPSARTIATTAPLTGGGDMTANRTLGVSVASESAVGVVELATAAETITGTDATRANTPAGGRAAMLSYVDPIAATRAPSSYGQSDGVTSNRGVVYTNSARQSPADLPTVEYALDVVGYASPASLRFLFHAASATTQPTDQNWSMTIGVSAGGLLFVSATGATAAADARAFLDTVLFATRVPSGTRARMLVTVNSGTGNPVIRLAGSDISSSFSLNYGSGGVGTAPPWLSASLVGTTMVHGYVTPAGEIPAITPILGSLSTAERADYFATGRLPAWVMAGGSAVAVTAGSFVTRSQYVIRSVGTTDFTLVGAASNTVGVQFLATGAGTGTGTASQAGALTAPAYQGTGTTRDLTTLGGTQPNQGRMVGVRPILATPSPINISVFPLSTTGAFLTLASTNPLAFTPQRIVRAEVIVDTAGADLTFRRNSSSTNDIVTALTDIPSASTATALTLIAAQTRLAPTETVWGSLSAGTGYLVIETADSL
jgi:hypothetical protein